MPDLAPDKGDSPAIHFEDVLVRETGADLRLRGQNIWNVAQFFTGLVASLLAVSFALFAGAVPSISDATRAGAVLAVSLVAGLLGLGAVYTYVFECFHWAHARRSRQRILGEWLKAGPASRWEDAASHLRIDVHILLARVSTPTDYRAALLTSDASAEVKGFYLDGLKDEILPQKGTRYLLRVVLYVLTGLSAGVSFLAGALLGSKLTTAPSGPLVVLTALAAIAPYVVGWVLLSRAFKHAGISKPDPQLILFDLDKTLVDLAPDDSHWAECNRRARELAAAGSLGVSDRATAYEVYRTALTTLGKTAPLTEGIAEVLDDWELRFVGSSARPARGLERLTKLVENGHVLGIVSSNGAKCLAALFSTKRLPRDWFTVVVSRDDVSDIKPSPVPLQIAWARSPVQSRGWFAGDSAWDLMSYESFSARDPGHLKFALIGNGVRELPNSVSRFTDLGGFVRQVSHGN